MAKEIPLTKGKVTIVDDDDYDFLMQWKWHYGAKGYAVTSTSRKEGKRKVIFMHRFIMNCPSDMIVDHIDRNTLNNQKSNLRICTKRENSFNKKLNKGRSEFQGVMVRGSRFQCLITHDGKQVSKGTYMNEIAAANCYNYYAKEYYGEFACLNEVLYMPKEEWEKYKTKQSSPYRGVTYHKVTGKWMSQIIVNKVKVHIGIFENEIDAAKAYDEKAVELLGVKAKINKY